MANLLPASLPSIAHAKLPKTYESAKSALAECTRLDECDAWANKAEAMASYAKQAEDDGLMQMAQRIKARAIRRCGELLRAIAAAQGANQNIRVHVDPKVTRTSAARDAGMSERRTKQALRIANIPAPAFEAAVEAPRAPTMKALAEQGKRPAPEPLVDLGGRNPKDYAVATQAQGHLRTLAEFAGQAKPAVIVRGSKPHEFRPMRQRITTITDWLTHLCREMDEAAR